MPQDAFTIKYVAAELENLLTGGKISRIIQPDRDNLIFIIYTKQGNIKLEACLGASCSRLGITKRESEVPQTAPNFCMLLRKHLQNAEILKVVQPDFERIIYFDLKCISDFSSSVMRLYFEIMGKYSNAILCENGVISGALKTTFIGENTKRILFGGVKYVPPEPQDKVSPENMEELSKILKNSSGDMAKFISDKVKGIAYVTALDMVKTYGENISAKDIYDYIFTSPKKPCVVKDFEKFTDFKVRAYDGDRIFYPTVLEAQDAYYTRVLEEKAFSEKKTRLKNLINSAIKKHEKRLADIAQKLEECNEADILKLKGELITANIYAIERGMSEFYAVNYYDPDCKKIKIELDKNLSPSQNAQKYFKRYAKLKRTKENVTSRKGEADEKYEYLKSIDANICAAETLLDLAETEDELISFGIITKNVNTRKKTAELPFRVYEISGFKVYSGRNNLQNDRLVRGLSPEDMWLHTQKYHSSHMAVISEGREIPDEVLKTAAEICAYYSEGRDGAKIPVDYTKKKFLKRPPKSSAGFVTYSEYSTILVDPNAHKELSNG